MMKVRNGEHNHSEMRKPKKAKRRVGRTKKKTTAVPTLTRPNFGLLNLPPLVPSHLPKFTPKNIPENDENQPIDDMDTIVDILD